MRRPPRYDLPKAAPGKLRLVQLFLNTTDHEHRELLGTPKQVRTWFAEHGIEVGRSDRAAVRRVQTVREELRALVGGSATGTELAAAAGRASLAVDLDRGCLRSTARGVDRGLGEVLAVVYDAMHDGTWERLKTCRNCRWAYWDASRNRSAAWCSMQLCGNRLKVRRFRTRTR
jgi:predicted RNA-binding Zn ribbon-like protein